jgi:L-fuconolactonase
LKGLRHVVHDEPDDNFILRQDFNQGITAMLGTGLIYEILIYERHLPQTIEFVDRHPEQPFVLDHGGKPRIQLREMESWSRNIRALAERQNVSCKLSGLVTEADWTNWSAGDLRPYYDVLLESFGVDRLMMGSDWPVCLVASGYLRWFQTVETLIGALSAEEQGKIRGGNAIRIYNLHS